LYVSISYLVLDSDNRKLLGKLLGKL